MDQPRLGQPMSRALTLRTDWTTTASRTHSFTALSDYNCNHAAFLTGADASYYLTAGAFIPIVTTASRFMQKPDTAASYP